MAQEEIQSPPYPGEGTTDDLLYVMLGQLRTWVIEQRVLLNDSAGQELVPRVGKLPEKSVYLAQPVAEQYTHLMFLRKLRECWDHVVRSFEDDWDQKECVAERIMMAQTAAQMLHDAFISFEVREAKAKDCLDRIERIFEHLKTSLRSLLEGYRPPDEQQRTFF